MFFLLENREMFQLFAYCCENRLSSLHKRVILLSSLLPPGVPQNLLAVQKKKKIIKKEDVFPSVRVVAELCVCVSVVSVESLEWPE